ncbi:helix-turn-helix transcriptional regulator [Campylobacter geochelonis]|uniref:Transcriptional regulator n=1 Tax=Campylobacter geochelonis TaxID=1780362 RepID=A0A128ED62_9BACT|nr:WYL domain-containing protein [Campylobacter geochelonis]QKF70371.1 transcriptional regulator (WYL domain) [Campylobacter geochelonis]CZE46421.1 transcriptional regulator [Campylobacter geochelonis]
MSKNSSTKRVCEILKRLNEGKYLNTEHLALEFETSERSIRRDFELIRELFGDILAKNGKNYTAFSKFLLQDTLSSSENYLLKNIIKLSKRSNLKLVKDMQNSFINTLIKDDEYNPYLFKIKPYEEIYAYKDTFKSLENAIIFQKEVNFIYDNYGKITKFKVKPYKIVFMHENFYLASQNKNDVLISRIAMIKDLNVTAKTFTKNYEILDFISDMQTTWAKYSVGYKSKLKECIIKVSKKNAKYFLLKKFMPSQEILNSDDDGNIYISYKVTNELEMFGLFKQWLFDIEVLKPRSFIYFMKKLREPDKVKSK